jgi:AcrR family transcriptional regulator
MAVYSKDTRALARRLRRRKQMSIDQLSRRLGVPRSTIYNWVGDIPIPGSGPGGGFKAEDRQRGTRAMTEGRRRQRELYYTFGLENYGQLRSKPAFRDFLVSYMAVGKKGDRHEVSFSHPDPAMMQLASHWLTTYGRNRLRYRLQVASDSDPERAVAFWAERLGIPAEAISCEVSNEVSGTRRGNLLGTMRISSTDTLLRVELQAWADCARAEWRSAAADSKHQLSPPC